MTEFEEGVWGDPAKKALSVYDYPSVYDRLRNAFGGVYNMTYGPTGAHLESLEIAQDQYEPLKAELKVLVNEVIPAFEQKMIEAGAPWMSGQPLK